MVAEQDDSGNKHFDKDYLSSESKKKANTAAYASHTNTSDQKQILPVPSYDLYSTYNYNSPQYNSSQYSSPQYDLKEHSWDDRGQKEITKPMFDSDKSNIDSLFFSEQGRDKIIMPVPNSELEGRKAGDWDEEVILPSFDHGSGSTDTHFRAEQQRMQKLIMPVHFSSVSDEDLQSADEDLQSAEELPVREHRKETVMDTVAQAKSETVGKYDEKSKGAAQVIQGVLQGDGKPQEVSLSDRKQMFGDPRTNVEQPTNLKENIQKTSVTQFLYNKKYDENIYKSMNEMQDEEIFPKIDAGNEAAIPWKESSAQVSGPLQSGRETKEQKIASDTKQQKLTEKGAVQEPVGLKSLKKGAESGKQIVSPLATDKSKESTDVKKVSSLAIDKSKDSTDVKKVSSLATDKSKDSTDVKKVSSLGTDKSKDSTDVKQVSSLATDKSKDTTDIKKVSSLAIDNSKDSTDVKKVSSLATDKSKVSTDVKKVSSLAIDKSKDSIDVKKVSSLATDKSKDSTDVKKVSSLGTDKSKDSTDIKKVSSLATDKSKDSTDVKKIPSLATDKLKDSTDVKKEVKSKAQVIQGVLKESGTPQEVSLSDRKQMFGDPRKGVEQPSNLKENIQETSGASFHYKKKYSDTEKPVNKATQDLDHSIKDFADEDSLTYSKQPHNISATGKSHVETEKVKPMASLGKKEKGKAYAKITDKKVDNLTEYGKLEETSLTRKSSVQEDTSAKYEVSEGKRDSDIERRVFGTNIKKKLNNQGEPKSKISDIKKIYRDEPSAEKEKLGRMTDDNVSAIEKYLEQELSKVSHEKVRRDMTEPKKDGDFYTGETSKVNAKSEAEIKTIPSKHSTEQKGVKRKKIHQSKDNNTQPDTKSTTTDLTTKHQEINKIKEAISKPIKEGLVRGQQKIAFQEGPLPEETKGSPLKETKGPPSKETKGSPPREPKGSPPREPKGSPPREPKGSPPREPKGSPPKGTKGSPPKETSGSPSTETKGSPPKETKGSPPKETKGSVSKETKGSERSGSPPIETKRSSFKETKGSPPKETYFSESEKPDMHSSFHKYSTRKKEPDAHSSFEKYSTGKNEPDMHSSFNKYSRGENEPDMHSSFDKYSTGKNEPNMHSSYDKNSARKHEPDMQSFGKYSRGKKEPDTHSSFDKYSTGKNEPNVHSSYNKYSTRKNEPNMNSSFDKYSTAKNQRTEEILHDTQNTYFKADNTNPTHQQRPDHSSKTVSQSQATNLSSESTTRQGITSQSITLLDSPPRYMVKDIKESEMTRASSGELHPGITQNSAWPGYQLSTVNEKYLGKPARSSWGDAGTLLPWVTYAAQKKNNQDNIVGDQSGQNRPHENGYTPRSPLGQFLGRQYAVFKDNFNNHTIRGRANVAKATLLALGLFTMWQMLKPKRCELTFQRCSECGSVTPIERKH